MEWETVIGLEIHVQLATQSKLFSGAATQFGAEPNTQACTIDLGLPGVLPVLNQEAVRLAVKFGLSIDAEITHVNYIPGTFSVKFSTDTEKNLMNRRLFPGMKAKVKITAIELDNVITVPNSLINGNSVWIMTGKGKQKKTVKKGPTNGKVTVILKGLQEGDKVTSK